MKMTMRLLAKLGILPLLAVLSTGSVSAQTGCREGDTGQTDCKGRKTRERLRKGYQEILQQRDARRGSHDLLHASLRGQDKPQMCVRT